MSNVKCQIKNWKLEIGLLVVLVVLVVFPAKAGAAGLSLGVHPPILQIETEPPASIKAPIVIQNLGEEVVELDILFKPFTAEGENGEIKYIDEIRGANPLIFQKMQVFDGNHNIKNLILAPKQEKKLDLHIGIGKEEPPSDYYFSIVFLAKTNSEATEQSKQSNLSQTPGGIATNVLLTIGPKGKAQGAIEEFSTPFFLERGPVPFTVRVKNTSPHSIIPKGTILISNMFNQPIGKVDLLPVNILSQTIRAIPDSLQNPDATRSSLRSSGQAPSASSGQAPSSKLTPETSNLKPIAYWPESFLLGPYAATLTIALSENGPLFSRTIHFIAFPAQLSVGLLVAILILLLILSRLRSRLKNA